jgi:small subunit ribosomal protein S4
MARYTGPKVRVSRRFGQPIFGPAKELEKREYPPGQHGPRGRRKLTDYAVGLLEKQKLRMIYGLQERQFRRTFEKAKHERGVTGERFLQLLETRLDNVVYILGFAKSRPAARQFVNHGHVKVNGRKVDISSYTVKPGDVIEVRERPVSQQAAGRCVEETRLRPQPAWITRADGQLKATVNRLPTREEMDPTVNEQLIVEFYSR